MKGPVRNTTRREHDYQVEADMYLSGVYQSAIATKLGISQQQVSYDLKVLQKRWQESALVNIDVAKGKELARCDTVERWAWRSFKRSVRIAEKSIEMSRIAGEVKFAEKRVEREQLIGDPRFLTIVMQCIERRCKILGMDAPVRSELTGKNGGPIQIKAFDYSDAIAELKAADSMQIETSRQYVSDQSPATAI